MGMGCEGSSDESRIGRGEGEAVTREGSGVDRGESAPSPGERCWFGDGIGQVSQAQVRLRSG
jgi:hypothetical protein